MDNGLFVTQNPFARWDVVDEKDGQAVFRTYEIEGSEDGDITAASFGEHGDVWMTHMKGRGIRSVTLSGNEYQSLVCPGKQRVMDMCSIDGIVYGLLNDPLQVSELDPWGTHHTISLYRWKAQKPQLIASLSNSKKVFVYLEKTRRVICFDRKFKYTSTITFPDLDFKPTSFSVRDLCESFVFTGALNSVTIFTPDGKTRRDLDLKINSISTVEAKLISATPLSSGEFAVIRRDSTGIHIIDETGRISRWMGTAEEYCKITSNGNDQILAINHNHTRLHHFDIGKKLVGDEKNLVMKIGASRDIAKEEEGFGNTEENEVMESEVRAMDSKFEDQTIQDATPASSSQHAQADSQEGLSGHDGYDDECSSDSSSSEEDDETKKGENYGHESGCITF